MSTRDRAMSNATTIIAALGAAFLLTTAARAQAPEPGSAPGWVPEISTSAIGEVKTAPDRATIVLGVETRAATAGAASATPASRRRS